MKYNLEPYVPEKICSRGIEPNPDICVQCPKWDDCIDKRREPLYKVILVTVVVGLIILFILNKVF